MKFGTKHILDQFTGTVFIAHGVVPDNDYQSTNPPGSLTADYGSVVHPGFYVHGSVSFSRVQRFAVSASLSH